MTYEYSKILEVRMMDEESMFDYIRANNGKMVINFFSNWNDWINIEKGIVIRTRKVFNRRIVQKVELKNVKIEDEA